MNDVTEQIAQVIDKHSPAGYYEGFVSCCCNTEQYTSFKANAIHVASEIVAALGLKQQFTWSWPASLIIDGKRGYGYPVETRSQAEAEGDPSYMIIVSRWVSEWRKTE